MRDYLYQYLMTTSSTRTPSPQTTARSLRKLLIGYMESPPPICAWIRGTRDRLKEEARIDGGATAATEFSQEAVARRIGVTLKAYRAWETNREPNRARRRQIARALGLEEDYFEATRQDEDLLRAMVHEEVSELRAQMGRIEKLLQGRARSRRE